MKTGIYKMVCICLIACTFISNQITIFAQTISQPCVQVRDNKTEEESNKICCPAEQTPDQTEDQQRMVKSIKILPYDTHEKHLIYDHHMLMGEDCWLQAEIYFSDGTVERTSDDIIKENVKSEKRKVKWILTTKEGVEPQAACLEKENNRVEILSRCGCPETLEVRAVLSDDETMQSDPYEIDVLEVYTDPIYGTFRGQKKYFHFSSGNIKDVKIPHEKEQWNRDTGEYTILLPKVEQKNELFVFKGWLNLTPDKEGKEQMLSETSLTQERRLSPGGCSLVAQWSRKKSKFKCRDVSYRVKDGVRHTVVLSKNAVNKKNVFMMPKVLKYLGNEHTINEIGNRAFQNDKKIKKIYICDSLEAIGDSAFRNCTQLNVIQILSKNIKSVGKGAFEGINKSAVIYCPKECISTYKKMFHKAGLSKQVKFKENGKAK